LGAFSVIPPLTEPVSLAEARAHLRLDTTDTDATLAGYIITARQYAEAYTRRAFLTQTWDASFDYDWPTVRGCVRLDLPLAPVISVSSVTYTDADSITQTVDSTDYLVRGTGAENFPYIVPDDGVTFPETLAIPETIRVRFIAGYGSQLGDVPEPIRTAILLHTEILYDRNPASMAVLQAVRDSLLDPFRIVRV
jgi:uncharacterized phiE125 gp8 family phage protein